MTAVNFIGSNKPPACDSGCGKFAEYQLMAGHKVMYLCHECATGVRLALDTAPEPQGDAGLGEDLITAAEKLDDLLEEWLDADEDDIISQDWIGKYAKRIHAARNDYHRAMQALALAGRRDDE